MKDILKNFYKGKFIKSLMLLSFGVFFNAPAFAQRLQAFSDYFKGSPIGEVQVKESEHFTASWVHPRDEVIVESLLAHMEAAHQKLAPTFAEAIKPEKVPLEIFPDLKTFSDVSKLSLSRFRATGTIALTLEQRLMILSPRNLTNGYAWAETAVHEYIHYLIRNISPELIPIWLHEGTAQLFQAYPYEIRPQLKPSQWGLFQRRRAAKQLLSLKTLREPFPYRETPEEAELAYIQSFLFVNWLDQKCGIVPLLTSIEKKKSVDEGLEFCVGQKLSELEARFEPEVMASIEVPKGAAVEWYARDFSGRDPMEIEGAKADQSARNFAQLSTELFRQGRFKASGMEMAKALDSTPVSPPSWRRHLALMFSKSGQNQKADAVLKELLRDYPEDAAAWYLMGLRRLEQENWGDAWTALLHSFYQNPFLEGLLDQMQALQSRHPEFKDRFLLRDL